MQNPIPRPWRTPAALMGLSLIPFAATTSRLIWLSNPDAAPAPSMARFGGSWTGLIIHILCGSLFLILSSIQFSPELRARHRRWHRVSGRIAMLAGFVAGVSGVWLVVAYPPSDLATPVLGIVRVVFGAALAISILIAFTAIRKRNVARHRAWLIRAFALAVAGSTQALLIGLWLAVSGALSPESATALITIGFALNIAVAEWRIRTRAHTSSITDTRRSLT